MEAPFSLPADNLQRNKSKPIPGFVWIDPAGPGPTNITTFHPFHCLPYELRTQIWDSIVQPRTINVRDKSPPWSVTSKRVWQNLNYMISSTPAPAVLQVCREARNHGLYQKGFTEVANPEGVGEQ